ncbi:MAG: TonB-dependent receptor domain-containing protein [Gemmatimonadaceae bacterium]
MHALSSRQNHSQRREAPAYLCIRPLALLGLVVALTASGTPLAAQDATVVGRITGRVIDAASGSGLADVTLHIAGTSSGTSSGVDGRFTLARVPAGATSIQARRIGFAAKTVTGVQVVAGRTIEQNISLTAATVRLEAITVSATTERGSVSDALDRQRTASGVVNSVTAEQISRSPDGDAAQAVKRVSGVTVQDGKYVFVRGLGERYTTSSLNGARVPSPEPERRVVPLDMFPAGLLQAITTSKTFTPDLQGDFSGALVDIKTREFPSTRSGAFQIGSGYAGGATGRDLLLAPMSGSMRFASIGSERDVPAIFRRVGNMQTIPLNQNDKNLLIGSLRNVWTPSTRSGSPLLNTSGSIGGNDPILFGHRVGYLFSGSYSSGTDIKDGQLRALADRGATPGSTVEMDRFVGTSTSQSVLWGGLTNLSTLVGESSRLSFNGMYNRSADNDARVEVGEFTSDATPVQITRMQYTQRSVYSGQLAGEHQVTGAQKFEWSATASGVRRDEPDKSAFVQVFEKNAAGQDVLRWQGGGSGGAVRSFSDLNENSHEYQAKYSIDLSAAGTPSTIRFGGLYRATGRDAQSLSYNVSSIRLTDAQRELPLEQIFDGRFTQQGQSVFDIGPLSQGGSYVARDRLGAGFLMAEVPVSDRLKLVGGARYESDRLEVDAASTLGSPVSTIKLWNDWLPSLAATLRLTDAQQLRLSASRTLARPEYRELSPIISRDVIGGENVQGDENLQRTNVTNLDLRWETYPSAGEAVSLALFAKHFSNPIERVYGSGSGGTSYVFFTNAQAADNYGVELELRKRLGMLGSLFDPFSAFANATLMKSEIELAPNTAAAATNLNRRMVGQAPYVLNTGVTYTSRGGGTSATVLFNRVGERIAAAGASPLPDVVDLSRNVLDFSVRSLLLNGATLRFDLKNLLDSPYETRQGTVVRERYHAGRVVQLGLQLNR